MLLKNTCLTVGNGKCDYPLFTHLGENIFGGHGAIMDILLMHSMYLVALAIRFSNFEMREESIDFLRFF